VRAADGDPALAAPLARQTNGNPFFVREVLRHLEEAGPQASIPEGVREVIGRRLSRLGDEANRTLALAAVIGAEFEIDVLARASDTSMLNVLDALDEAEHANVVASVSGAMGRYRFAHALVRRTLYDELSSTRRVRLHR